jgi:hypothetical protein
MTFTIAYRIGICNVEDKEEDGNKEAREVRGGYGGLGEWPGRAASLTCIFPSPPYPPPFLHFLRTRSTFLSQSLSRSQHPLASCNDLHECRALAHPQHITTSRRYGTSAHLGTAKWTEECRRRKRPRIEFTQRVQQNLHTPHNQCGSNQLVVGAAKGGRRLRCLQRFVVYELLFQRRHGGPRSQLRRPALLHQLPPPPYCITLFYRPPRLPPSLRSAVSP